MVVPIATTVSDALTYLERRFLRLPLSPAVRDTIRKTIEAGNGGADLAYSLPRTERALREMLHSIMSAPEYQLGLPVLSLSPVLGLTNGIVFTVKAGILAGAFYLVDERRGNVSRLNQGS